MPSTNGHGPKRAILYARVSTDEQARSGYSLAQQLEALREYAAREGYRVLEEVSDPGQSGASLERPGMDHLRNLVTAGGVSVVLAQDRDRFSREPAYTYLLRREFEEHGCELRSLNDRGDGSPEGDLNDGILDQLAKFERAKTAERSRRGKLRKAREGKIICGHTPGYGFRYNETRDGYEVEPHNMAVVRRIFSLIDHQGHCPGRCLPNAGLRANAGFGGGGAPDGGRLVPSRQGEALRHLVVQQIAQDAEARGRGHPERARVQDPLQERAPPPQRVDSGPGA
jgi:DNA invertase Pin-like site-specific DNA recombinase